MVIVVMPFASFVVIREPSVERKHSIVEQLGQGLE